MIKPIFRNTTFTFFCLIVLMACGENQKNELQTNGIKEHDEVPDGTRNLTVDLADRGIKIQPTMYGIFFEDINFGADGGLYSELIKNRSFEFPYAKMGWEQPNSVRYSLNGDSGFAKITDYTSSKGNKKYAHIVVNNDQNYELINEGFRGIGLRKGEEYDLSVSLANAQGIDKVYFTLIDSLGTALAQTQIDANTGHWKKNEVVITPAKTETHAKLKVTFEGNGSIDMDLVSLFPKNTWKGRKGGLRKDLIELLDGLNPGFVRFPGGCIVEGRTLAERYQWKKTVGPVDDRELLVNRWNMEFSHRSAPDYYQSFGLGFFEYFQLSEDLGAEPLPILGCGMACQFNTGELASMDELDPYIDDAIDLIEFANGNKSTPWGKLRAEMGHPEPFNLKYLGIGNEQWGEEYFERYKVLSKIIEEKYPDIILISTPGPFPDGDMFEYGWEQLKDLNVALVDEHYYRPPEWFLENADRYDSYDRNGPKVFAGEFAAHTKREVDPVNKNIWEAALAEAAFMTGLERNADLVHLTSYAPLLAHEEAWQWTPDLIWFNNLEAYGTVNYYVQKMYSNNPGTDLLLITENGEQLTGQQKLYASIVKDEHTQELIIKVVNTANVAQEISISTKEGALGDLGTITTMKSNNLEDANSFESPQKIAPQSDEFKLVNGVIGISLDAQSFNVIKVKIKN